MKHKEYPWKQWIKNNIGKDINNWHVLGYAGLLDGKTHCLYARCKCGIIQSHIINRFMASPTMQCVKCSRNEQKEMKYLDVVEAKELYGYVHGDNKKLY